MPYARIYCPPKTAMQSGKSKTKNWVLEYNTAGELFSDPLMGWTGTTSTAHQISLRFSTLEEAVAYARQHGIEAKVEPNQVRRVVPKSYADNFRYDRPRG